MGESDNGSTMLTNLLFILLALLMLFIGAEGLVRGSAALARRAGLSPLVVGLTVVAFGTSSPELVVSAKAALSNQGDIAVGNVVGSNIFNIAVILGVTALVFPVPVHLQVIRIDAPIALGVTVLLVMLLLDRAVGRIEGALLLGGILGYTWMNIVLARREGAATAADPGEPLIPRPSRHWAIDLLFIAGGLVVLVMGSRLLVSHSVDLATRLGVSEAVIGLTIVAAGTSMPELATSLVAAIRRQPDIAVGNVIGSNVFNSLGIVGAASMLAPLSAPGISSLDLAAMVIVTVVLLPLLVTGRRLQRVEGIALLAMYGVYLALRWPG
ncbi:MAG: calcium/sodium antiporter [Phycisphaeraceae bacterium]|nr:calcium/sodium antiporter [Phycisphaeraceae bacterium]